MIATPALALLFFANPVGDLALSTDAEVPEDAQMGDGLRLHEPQNPPPPPAVTCADGEMLRGVDISKWQGDVNWNAIAGDGMSFAFVRVSDGINTKDQFFDKNWAEARDAGLYTGVYQFFRPNQNIRQQADYLLEKMGCDMTAKTCPWTSMDLPPVIDVEHRPSGWSKTQMRNAIRAWIDRVEDFGVEPIVYSGRYFWRDYVGSDEWADHPFWIAHYTNNCPNIPSHWQDWDFWQFTESGSVAGVSGGTDTNNFNGSIDMLKALRPDGADGPAPDEACGRIAANDVTVVDNASECFSLHGPNQYWRTANGGIGGNLNWTKTTSGTEFNYGVWTLNFDEAGKYEVHAHVDADFTEASVAKYSVTSSNGTDVPSIDQRPGGWIRVGEFNFDAGHEGQKVKLSDATGIKGQQLQFDAIRLVPEGIDPGDTIDSECGDDHSSRVDDEDDADLILDSRGDTESCSVGGRSTAPWMLSFLLLGLVARRRRSA